MRLAAGDVLYREGDPVEAIYRVRRGLVKLMTYLPTGEARIVRLQHRGSWLGLGGFLERPYSHTAVAVRASQVDRFPMGELNGMHEHEPKALNRLLVQWHADLAQADTWINDFSTGTIRIRMARLLRYLAELEERDPGIVRLLTVQEMGEILGVTPESVSRILAAFKRAGILRRPSGLPRDVFRVDTTRLLEELRRG